MIGSTSKKLKSQSTCFFTIKAMEVAAGLLLDAVIRLLSCGKVHAAYVYKLEENLALLQKKWIDLQNLNTDVHRRIDDAEGMGEMQRADEVNGWLQDVQDLQKVMEDIQDEDSQETQNKCSSGCCQKNCMLSYKLGKKIVKMLNEVDRLVNSGKRFVDMNVYIAYKLPPKLMNEMPSVETVGLDLMLNQAWNSLEDDNVGIIGLYGMGGAGKTTLMMRVHNEFGKREHKFSLVLWVVVSRDCDINKIMNDIRNRLGIIDDVWNKSSQHERVTRIYEVLKQRKFVLMLDDVWGKLELEMVGVPLPKDTNNQSKVLFTTRLEDVCAKMQAQKKFKVECLLEQEAFDLFCKKVGDETLKSHLEIPRLAWEMTKECKGLPLAIITVGSAMAGVKSVEAWRQAKNDLRSSPWIASYLENEVFRILKFSYDRLPDDAHKNCFLYCALYPEDYEVGVDVLIDRWIGEGFLSGNKTKKSIYDMYEQGESIIEKLKLSCLLEGVEYDYFWTSAIKMHDVTRDMALWIARDQDENKGKVVVQGEALAMSEMDVDRLNIVERISIIDASGSWNWQVPTCPNLITLCILDYVNTTFYSNLQSMTRLKVLDLSGKSFEHLPVEIGNLINLEFLNLTRTDIRNRLPIELKNLKNVRVFLMEGCPHNLEIIPLEVIESLEQLKVFRFTSEDKAGELFEEAFLQKLESLPKLEEVSMEINTFTGMHKLIDSTKLQGCWRHFSIQGIDDPLEMSPLLASMSRMKHLYRISLYSINIIEGSSITNTCYLHKLRRVYVESCDSITHLTWLIYAPLLEFLEVRNCDSIEELVKEAQNDIFQNLRLVRLYGLAKLRSIHKSALDFPFLAYLHVYECPDLKKLPLNSNSAKDLIAIKGQKEWWNSLEWQDTDIKELLHSKFRAR
ncbi:probable disease resistance protein At5g63020 isoform X2 [Lotus japonicus]|uniref:probable disease resistance protein At5g63020 isoform X2 n=1 Tax=Lotus japonicus TaxID=34305 RepID=UPI00258EF82C|nr:probable disease resistance protein At5g63020 isoform X2 [Lotus japonicus]